MGAAGRTCGALAAAAALLAAAAVPAARAAPATVVATIGQIGEPLARIAGGHATGETLMGPGVDPHLYRLTRSDVARLNRARLIVHNGLHLEARMRDMMVRFSRRKPVVAIAESLPRSDLIPLGGEAYDPHVWMDPALWMRALGAAVDALAALDPPNADAYRRRAAAYFSRMAQADARAREALASIPDRARALVTAHDAFGYFGRAYGIDVLAVQGASTESEPGLRRVEELADILASRRIAAVFVETSVSARSVEALIAGAAARRHRVAIGGTLFSDALGPRGRETGTWLGMFEHNVRTIVRALGGIVPARLASRLTTGRARP